MPDTIARAAVSALPATETGRLAHAVRTLERPGLAMRLADYAGQPVNQMLRLMPRRASDRLDRAARRVVLRCLQSAIETLEDAPPAAPATGVSTALGGVTGALGGLLGLAGLAVELPFTTLVMLRSIADIARIEGEDLSDPASRLACLEVFALGVQRQPRPVELGYYAARALMGQLGRDVTRSLIEGRIADASAPAVARLVAEIAGRFGLALSERAAASALPVVGAVGGATVNIIFIDHFQRVAQAHFLIRRLERRHGEAAVRQAADALTTLRRPA